MNNLSIQLYDTIFPALDECERSGEVCPSELFCLKNENGTFACRCDADSKEVGEGYNRTCQRTILYQIKSKDYVTLEIKVENRILKNSIYSLITLLGNLGVISEQTFFLNQISSLILIFQAFLCISKNVQ